jgi:hypothetical protein
MASMTSRWALCALLVSLAACAPDELAFTDVAIDAGADARSGGGSDATPVDATTPLDAMPDITFDGPPPDCSSATDYACVPDVPPGWSLPGVYYSAAYGSPPAACNGPWPIAGVVGTTDLTAAAATCSQCFCGAPSATCAGNGQAIYYNMDNCMGTGTNSTAVSGCSATAAFNIVSANITAPAAGPVTCTPTGGTPTVPQLQWGHSANACLPARAGLGCTTGNVCVPKPTTPFSPTTCTTHAGDMTCPTAYAAFRTVVYTSVDDSRGCTTCQCTQATGATCAVGVTQFTSPSCPTGTGTNHTSTSGTCAITMAPSSVNLSWVTMGGSCTSSGGVTTGTASGNASTATTVCCL